MLQHELETYISMGIEILVLRTKENNINAYREFKEIGIISGGFSPGENIVGGESGATYALRVQDTWDSTNRTSDDGTITTTPFSDNETIELRAKVIYIG